MRKYNILWRGALAFLLAAGLYGCIKDDTFADDNETVDMTLSLDTYAANNDPNAADNEAVVKSAWVYIFNAAGVLENPGKTAVPLLPSGEAAGDDGVLNAVWSVAVGQKEIYVLLNAGNIIRSGVPQSLAGYNPSSKAELESLFTNPANFDTDFSGSGTAGMLMSGKTPSPVNVSASGAKVTVPVARRYARIDLNLRRKAELAGSTIVVEKTTLKNRRTTAAAFALATESTGSDAVYENDHADVTIGSSTSDYTAVTSFYTMPRTGAAEAACVEIKVSVDGTTYDLPIYINSGAIDGGTANDKTRPLDIAANYVYQIDATLGAQGVELNMNILEWTAKTIPGDILGSSLIVESPLRISTGTPVVVETKADQVSVKLSDAAAAAGYSLPGAGFDGVLTVPVMGGKASIPITAPEEYLIGDQYKITFVAGNIRRDVELRLDGTPVLGVDQDEIVYRYLGGAKPYAVTSYIEINNTAKTKAPLPWIAEFSTDGGATWTTDRPSWVSAFTTSDDGSVTGTEYTAALGPQDAIDLLPRHDAALKAAATVSDYNLSNSTGGSAIQNTANCYIVNAPGTYRFPIVYGNAITDGSTYAAAYSADFSAGSGSSFRYTFSTHSGAAITNPYIRQNGNTPASAVIVWQDETNLVQNVGVSGDWITFSVPQPTIKQGNAIIAVRDAGGTILWSWHIWVTDYKPSDDKVVTNSYQEQNTFMPLNLGWSYTREERYDPRSVLVRITQPESGLSRTLTLTQKAFYIIGGNNPYYQWGRKDPLLPAVLNGSAVVDKPHSGSYGTLPTLSDGPGESVSQPGLMILYNIYPYDWVRDGNHTARWNASTTGGFVKTIYDPSPAGYRIPERRVFTGFPKNGGSVSASSGKMEDVNSPYTETVDVSESFAWEFYCNRVTNSGETDPSGGTIYFPLSGYRSREDGVARSLNTAGYCWTVDITAANNYVFEIQPSPVVNPSRANQRAYANSVRPVRIIIRAS